MYYTNNNNLFFTVPSGFPRDLTGTTNSAFSIYLSWNPPPLDEQSGDIVQYVINVTHAGTLVTTQYNSTTTYINITNLEPYTTYICVVAAGTSVGTGPFSHLFFIQTQESGKYYLILMAWITLVYQ